MVKKRHDYVPRRSQGEGQNLPRTSLDTSTLIAQLRETMAVAQLVGRAPAFLTAVAHIKPVARSGSFVLISGETGTGKELVARAVHHLSDRSAFPFIAVNCGSLSETLLEDELFGHEKGAYTGALGSRKGLIHAAEKGTLFLDEVDGLSPRAQISLLRLLQEKTYRALGSEDEKKADVRVIAATNADLAQSISEGTFRQDLFYRLCVFRFCLPSLRERGDDITLLAEHFLRKHAKPTGLPPRFEESARMALLNYHWPGNVRELENSVIRAVHLSEAGRIEDVDLDLPGFAISSETPPRAMVEQQPKPLQTMKDAKQRAVESFEREYLLRLMAEYNGNITRAARAAGKDRREIGKLLKKYSVAAQPRPVASETAENSVRKPAAG